METSVAFFPGAAWAQTEGAIRRMDIKREINFSMEL
jgi:hypothetical protein